MEIKNYILDSFPTVSPFTGIQTIEKKLLKDEYLVVIDKHDEFYGILTPIDIIKRPHKIVIDCLSEKEHISTNETVASILDKFYKNQCSALPVFQKKTFIGIILKHHIIDGLKNKVNELFVESLISMKIKEEFLHNLSHEVRTPLNSILGFLEIISKLDKKRFSIEKDEYYNIVKTSSDRFLLVMNDLIELALINSGDNFSIIRKNVNIETIFSELNVFFETTISLLDTNTSIRYENPDVSFVFFSDDRKIKHILYHLIDNAIKFSIGNNSQIVYGYKTDNQEIIFYVKNSGKQILEKEKKKIFEAFEKQEEFNNKLVDGLGIGLHLVKRLTELLGGKINFESNEFQTTFFFTIPLAQE